MQKGRREKKMTGGAFYCVVDSHSCMVRGTASPSVFALSALSLLLSATTGQARAAKNSFVSDSSPAPPQK